MWAKWIQLHAQNVARISGGELPHGSSDVWGLEILSRPARRRTSGAVIGTAIVARATTMWLRRSCETAKRRFSAPAITRSAIGSNLGA